MKMGQVRLAVIIIAGGRMRPLIGRQEHEQVHSQHIKEKGRAHLLTTQRGLGNNKNYLLHGTHLVELPLSLCPAELSEWIDSRFVPLLQRLQVQIPGAPTTHNGAP